MQVVSSFRSEKIYSEYLQDKSIGHLCYFQLVLFSIQYPNCHDVP